MIESLDWLRDFVVPGKRIGRTLVRPGATPVPIGAMVPLTTCIDCDVIVGGPTRVSHAKRCAKCRKIYRDAYRAKWAREWRANERDAFRQYRRDYAKRKRAAA